MMNPIVVIKGGLVASLYRGQNKLAFHQQMCQPCGDSSDVSK
jgi:hypothetical protein